MIINIISKVYDLNGMKFYGINTRLDKKAGRILIEPQAKIISVFHNLFIKKACFNNYSEIFT